VLYGILGVLVLALIGSAVGYGMAINRRKAAEQDQRFVLATTQYELALQDQRNGNLGMALSRVEYVMMVYPQFPGVDDKLKEILLAIGTSSTPVASNPLPIATPEPQKIHGRLRTLSLPAGTVCQQRLDGNFEHRQIHA